ncbi:MAG: hypothetical protein AAF826_05145 [Pseudomonadota bacterium]
MSRKDPRKSLSICPDRSVWVALKAQAGCSMGDAVRRLVADADWDGVPLGTKGRGTELSVQLPQTEWQALDAAAAARRVTAEQLVLGALEKAVS